MHLLRLAEQGSAALSGPAWQGDSLEENFKGLTQSRRRPTAPA